MSMLLLTVTASNGNLGVIISCPEYVAGYYEFL